MQQKLSDGDYGNIFDFHLDVRKVRHSARIVGPAKKSVLARFDSAYEAAVKEVCPWFNLENPASFFEASDNVVTPPSVDHAYSSVTARKPERAACKNVASFWKFKYQKQKDVRSCGLCGEFGDAAPDRAGRLLYFRQNEWVHTR
jgi:hypothetical protein